MAYCHVDFFEFNLYQSDNNSTIADLIYINLIIIVRLQI